MNQYEPDWYEDLQGDPLKNKTFTTALANRIKEKINSPVKSLTNYRILLFGGALALAIVVFVFSQYNSLFNKISTSTPNESASLDETIQGIPSDENLNELINKTSDEDKRHILHKEMIDDKSMLLFTRKTISNQKKMVWEVGYASWTSGRLEWEIEDSNKIEIDLVPESEYLQAIDSEQTLRFLSQQIKLTSGSFSQLIYGSIANQLVSEIRIIDKDHMQIKANLIKDIHGGYSLWYVTLPNAQENYSVEALNKNGEVLATLTK